MNALEQALNNAFHANEFNGFDVNAVEVNLTGLDSMDVADLMADLSYDELERDHDEQYEPEYDDSMDGDAASALASAGWGTDEDYGFFGEE